MIYGLQQERNFLCCTPNLRGDGERSHWPYKYHGPSTESGWIFILFKKKNVSEVWFMIYAERTEPNNTFVFSLISETVEWKKRTYIYIDQKWKKRSLKSSTSNRTSLVTEDQRQQITCILSTKNKKERVRNRDGALRCWDQCHISEL